MRVALGGELGRRGVPSQQGIISSGDAGAGVQKRSNSNDRLLKTQASSRISQRRGSPRPSFPERSPSTVLLVTIGLLALVNCSTGGLQSQASCAHGQRSSACEVIASKEHH